MKAIAAAPAVHRALRRRARRRTVAHPRRSLPPDLGQRRRGPLALDLQRTGALLLPTLELSLGDVAVSAYASPRLATNSWAFPDDVAFDSTIFGARQYALVGGFDVNLSAHRDYAGVSASTSAPRKPEALGRLGASDVPAVPQSPACGAPLSPAWSSASVRGVAGSRLHFHDDSIASGANTEAGLWPRRSLGVLELRIAL